MLEDTGMSRNVVVSFAKSEFSGTEKKGSCDSRAKRRLFLTLSFDGRFERRRAPGRRARARAPAPRHTRDAPGEATVRIPEVSPNPKRLLFGAFFHGILEPEFHKAVCFVGVRALEGTI